MYVHEGEIFDFFAQDFFAIVGSFWRLDSEFRVIPKLKVYGLKQAKSGFKVMAENWGSLTLNLESKLTEDSGSKVQIDQEFKSLL